MEKSEARRNEYNAKEKSLHKAIQGKLHKGTKGPQHLHQSLGQMSRRLADAAGETDYYRKLRSQRKHEEKHGNK
jgi:hypothetical protein